MARELCEDKLRNNTSMVSSGGFCYSDVSSNNPTIQTHLVNQIQAFESNAQEIFNLTTSMDLIGFTKNLQHHHQQHHQPNDQTSSAMWKGFFTKPLGNTNNPPGGPSSSKPINESTTDHFYQDQFSKPDFTSGISDTSGENFLVGGHEPSAASWQENRLLVDDSTLRCMFPCEANERPSQGLSLSLCSTNPSTIGLQSFELRHTNNNPQNHQEEMRFMDSSSREGFYGKSPANISQHQQVLQGQFQLRNSKYLVPAQELLNEFCSLGTKQTDVPKQKPHKFKQWEDESGSSSSSSRKQSLCSMEIMELQKRKRKLLSMLEEVERRYRHYCDQMKAVVSSFEAVAGTRAATVYSALASKAMSRHFRCLKDGIVAQIQATKRAMGEKDPIAPGTTRGETPRLRIIDQALRQQRAFQQMNIMETHPWRPQRGLPERSVSVLRAWLFEHFLHPYPSDVDKHILARQTGLSRSQVSNWFINARVRLWKPMVEEMYLEETNDLDNITNGVSSDGVTNFEESNVGWQSNLNPSMADQKPTPDQLVRIDSECLSSIISNPDKSDTNINKGSNKAFHNHHLHQEHHSFGNFGAVELDFSSYNHHAPGGVSYASHESNASNQTFNGVGGGGVSLTLGLQQHGGNGGVSLAFSPASQNSLFYARDHTEDCQPVQYSLLDGEGQNLPYRNLLGAQLLHDLAG